MRFPQPPTSSIDWAKSGSISPDIGRGHIEATYSTATQAWTKPRWVVSPILNMNGLASCLHYGQQAFEGLRAWRGPDGEINVFRPKDHARRMAQSCAAVAMPAPSEQLFLECLRQVIVANSHLVPPHGHAASLYIRPFVLGTGPQMAPVPPHEFTFYVFIAPVSPYLGTTAVDAVIVEEFDRAAPRGTGAVKVGGNYAPTMRWSEQARREGYGMTLHLDSLSHSYIDEFSTSAFIGMLLDDEGNRTLVVTDSDNVIESFTADSCVALAREAGWAVEKRPIPCAELGRFVEVVAAESAASLVPISSITRPSTGKRFEYDSAKTGRLSTPIHTELSKMLLDIQQGRGEDVAKWRYRVECKGEDEEGLLPGLDDVVKCKRSAWDGVTQLMVSRSLE